MKRSILAFLSILLMLMAAGCMNNPAQTTTTATVTEPGTLAPMPASVLIGALIRAGMPITNALDYDENTDPDSLLGKPHQYWFKAMFSLPSDGGEALDSVEVFATEADAVSRVELIKKTAGDTSGDTEYIYQSGVYILRISHRTSAADAEKYQAMFEKIVGH